MRPFVLLETNYGYVKQNPYQVAVLPCGATEPHNLHLPYGTDVYEGTIVGERSCEVAAARGGKVVLLPTIPYGTETNLEKFPLAMNVNPTTLFALIEDLVESLAKSGIRKAVILNSHGGNDLKPLLRQLYGKTPVQLFLCNWYTMIGDKYAEIFSAPDDHAGEMETSFILAYRPDLVARKPDGSLDADAGALAQPRFDALRKGWISITRPWHKLTTNTGAGNPHAASAEKGQRLIALVAERLGAFLAELSAAELDERFPFAS